MLPVVVQRGSRIAGYATSLPGHVTLTWQLAAPGAVTGRPHGGDGSVSTAQPATASVAAAVTPSAPTLSGGATPSRGPPAAPSTSSVPPTGRRPAAPVPSATLYAICVVAGLA